MIFKELLDVFEESIPDVCVYAGCKGEEPIRFWGEHEDDEDVSYLSFELPEAVMNGEVSGIGLDVDEDDELIFTVCVNVTPEVLKDLKAERKEMQDKILGRKPYTEKELLERIAKAMGLM